MPNLKSNNAHPLIYSMCNVFKTEHNLFLYVYFYPLPIRNLGAVVAVTKCSPSGDHWSSVVSGASVLAISFLLAISHNSMPPLRLPNPAKSNSAQ